MTRTQRLRRVLLVCAHCVRNLAYYRAGWHNRRPIRVEPFWNTVNGNFVDICVLEWCKLFGDAKAPHSWRRIVADRAAFERGLLRHLEIGANAFAVTVSELRTYRDKFVAHLDSELTGQIPQFAIVKASVEYYHSYILRTEGSAQLCKSLPTDLAAFYDACTREARMYYELRS